MMEHKVLVIDQNLIRLGETVRVLQDAGITARGEPSIPHQKPEEVDIIIVCLATIVGVDDLIDQVKPWGIKISIWCDRLPDKPRVRALLVSSLFNRYLDLVVDVLGPIPTLPDAILAACRDAALCLNHSE